MAHLAVVDAVICGMVLPLKLHAMLTGTHNVGCKVFGPVVIAMMILSLLSLANIALNRYVLVCKDPQVCLRECTSTRVLLRECFPDEVIMVDIVTRPSTYFYY